MNLKQTFIIAIAIIIASISHAYITKPVPVNYSKSKKDIGRYIMYDEYRFDTTNGEYFEPNGELINEFVPLME